MVVGRVVRGTVGGGECWGFITYNVLVSVTMKDSIIYVRVPIMSSWPEKKKNRRLSRSLSPSPLFLMASTFNQAELH